MAELKFNFSSFGVPKVKKTKTYEAKKPIVDKNIIGVVGIDITGNYYVTTKTKDYSITVNSYDITGKNKIYAVELQDNKALCIIESKKKNNDSTYYLPFCVGSIVKGHIRLILGKERFEIRSVLEISDISEEEKNYYRDLVHKYKKFYRDNYEEIRKCII